MSINLKRDSSVDERLAQILDSPFLARVVPHLPPETLHQLIRHRGLEACGELVTLASPAQLNSLLDLDLWRHPRPGRDEQFDVERFGEWLEVLVDTGESIAARTIAMLNKTVVIAGLSRYVRVFDPGIFEPTAQSDDELTDFREAMREGDSIHGDDASSLECEIGGYIVRARRSDSWDSIIALLVALEDEHTGYFHVLMQGCRDLSNSRPEESAMHDLLLEPEQHLHDLTIKREHRRSQQGYATPADARAFLEMARKPRPTGAVNPIVAAYFRAADEETEVPADTVAMLSATTSHANDVSPKTSDESESIEAVLERLADAGVMPERPRALFEPGNSDEDVSKLALLRRLMSYVRDTNETIYLTRTRELAFLANTLLAGCSVQSRPFTPAEASDAAAATCNLGLEDLSRVVSDSYLIDHDLIAAFERGWSVLHKEVSLFTAEQLIATLANINCVDREMRLELIALRRNLMKELEAGTPWRARDATEILAMLDPTTWISIAGLLDECPVLFEALTAVLDRHTTTVSPTAFDFIATADRIADVRTFMRKLADLLSL
jgi:hypothetical protein